MNQTPELKDTVLVVDDSPETLGFLNTALSQHGMTVLVALSGEQALDIAKKMLPDVVIMDAVMSTMDGFETCQKFKSDGDLQEIPIIFMTGLSDPNDILKGFNSGGVDYVTKPVNTKELIARIKTHLMSARVKSSTQQALDASGHNTIAVNSQGNLLWATPKARTLLTTPTQDFLTEHVQLNSSISRAIQTWLTHAPEKGALMTPAEHHPKFQLSHLGTSIQGEVLLRIIFNDNTQEMTQLINTFGVTTREAEVLLWVAKGKTNREMGQILELSPRTINKHLEQLFKKLNVENRTSAAANALAVLQNR